MVLDVTINGRILLVSWVRKMAWNNEVRLFSCFHHVLSVVWKQETKWKLGSTFVNIGEGISSENKDKINQTPPCVWRTVVSLMLLSCLPVSFNEFCYIRFLSDRVLCMPLKRRAQLWCLNLGMLKKTIMKPFRNWGSLNRSVLNLCKMWKGAFSSALVSLV